MTQPQSPRFDGRLGVDQAISFWDGRHRQHGELLSGGDMTYDHATNGAFYALRLGRLLDIVDTSASAAAPLRILDAGCGKGRLSRALSRCGHRVDGIDSTDAAIDECRRLAIGAGRYIVCRLDEWAPSHLYDAVVALDVLFHVMDDGVPGPRGRARDGRALRAPGHRRGCAAGCLTTVPDVPAQAGDSHDSPAPGARRSSVAGRCSARRRAPSGLG